MTDNTDPDYAKAIFGHIDDCFTDEVGPVAAILCKETRIAWAKELKDQDVRRTLKTVPLYIDKLAEQIEDPEDRQRFLVAAYSIDALRYHKK